MTSRYLEVYQSLFVVGIVKVHVKRYGLLYLHCTGRPRLLDSDDEEFICKAIEDKATYHGRRSEPTMYTNRRVKVRDLMGIANFNLSKRGKLTVKSAITVLNRSRARNKRSIQGKKHIGENNVRLHMYHNSARVNTGKVMESR